MATFKRTPHPEPKQKPTEWPNLGRIVWYDPLKTRYGYPEPAEFAKGRVMRGPAIPYYCVTSASPPVRA